MTTKPMNMLQLDSRSNQQPSFHRGTISARSKCSTLNIPACHLSYLIEQSEELYISSKVHEFLCLLDVESSRLRLAWHLWPNHVICDKNLISDNVN